MKSALIRHVRPGLSRFVPGFPGRKPGGIKPRIGDQPRIAEQTGEFAEDEKQEQLIIRWVE
jgi:hypothetical protein